MSTTLVIFDSALSEWRMLKYRSFLGSISQQNIRSQQRPRIQELGTLDTHDSLGTRHG